MTSLSAQQKALQSISFNQLLQFARLQHQRRFCGGFRVACYFNSLILFATGQVHVPLECDNSFSLRNHGLYLLNVSQAVSESVRQLVSPSAKFVPVVATKLLYILLSNFTQPLSVLISKHLLILKAIGLNILQIIQFCYSNYNLCMGIAACAPKHACVLYASRMTAHAITV